MSRVKANSFYMPLKSQSVQAVITSPPYFGLREFDIPEITVGGWTGQYGLERDLQAYLDHTMLWIREVWRILRDDGVFFLNIGDSYASDGGIFTPQKAAHISHQKNTRRSITPKGIKRKSKLAVPERVIIRMIDEGWIYRNKIIWHKTSALPESVKDRFASRYEHILFFSKNPRYFFDLDAVRENYKESSIKRVMQNNMNPQLNTDRKRDCPKGGQTLNPKQFIKWKDGPHGQKKRSWGKHRGYFDEGGSFIGNIKGKNPGDVWAIPAQSYRGSHYATFPEALVERMMLCSTRPGDIVLDPFAGSGTTGKVAVRLGRYPVLLDLGYHHLQKERMNNTQKVIAAL